MGLKYDFGRKTLPDTIIKSSKPLAEQVAEQITELIQDNTFTAGKKLPNEFELAEKLNVGRGTVREAVKLLVSRNILEILRGKGTFVSKNPGVSEDPLGFTFFKDQQKLALDLIEVRLLFEPAIASMAAKKATPENIKEMTFICEKIEEKMQRAENYVDLDIELHTCFARATQNRVVSKLIPIITRSVAINIKVTNRALWRETQRDHRDVVNAIAKGDTQKASAAMVRHLVTSNYDVVSNIYVDPRFSNLEL